MALVKKGSRLINVDDTTYRWRLRGRPTYDQGLVHSPLTYAVEHADNPGTTLVITTNQPHPSNWFGTLSSPVVGVLPNLPNRVRMNVPSYVVCASTAESAPDDAEGMTS